jgi:hypothetical protein
MYRHKDLPQQDRREFCGEARRRNPSAESGGRGKQAPVNPRLGPATFRDEKGRKLYLSKRRSPHEHEFAVKRMHFDPNGQWWQRRSRPFTSWTEDPTGWLDEDGNPVKAGDWDADPRATSIKRNGRVLITGNGQHRGRVYRVLKVKASAQPESEIWKLAEAELLPEVDDNYYVERAGSTKNVPRVTANKQRRAAGKRLAQLRRMRRDILTYAAPLGVALGLSRREIARQLGVPEPSIRRAIKRRSEMDTEQLRRIEAKVDNINTRLQAQGFLTPTEAAEQITAEAADDLDGFLDLVGEQDSGPVQTYGEREKARREAVWNSMKPKS